MAKDIPLKLSLIELFEPEFCPPNFSIEDYWTDPEPPEEDWRWPKTVMEGGVVYEVLGEYEDEEEDYYDSSERECLFGDYRSAESCFVKEDYQKTLDSLKECDEVINRRKSSRNEGWGLDDMFVEDIHLYNESVLNRLLGNIDKATDDLPPPPLSDSPNPVDLFSRGGKKRKKSKLASSALTKNNQSSRYVSIDPKLGNKIDDQFRNASEKNEYDQEFGDKHLLFEVLRFSNYGTLCFKQAQEIAQKNTKRRMLKKFEIEARAVSELLYRNVKNYPRQIEAFKDYAALLTFNLAYLVLLGIGGLKEPERATKLFQEISDQFPKAKFNLGAMYYCGLGVPRDYVEAAAMYYEAGLAGVPLSNGLLGFVREYLSSAAIQTAKKETKSDELMKIEKEIRKEQKAEQSPHLAEAKRNLLKLIPPTTRFVREGVDYKHLSSSLICKLAEASKGKKKSNLCFRLGFLYAYGLGVKRDTRKAIKCYEDAARTGEKQALFNLGCIFQNRARNPELLTAYGYFSLAEVENVRGAGEQLEELESNMSKTEILEAQEKTRQLQSVF
jgi:TPR repeat protein